MSNELTNPWIPPYGNGAGFGLSGSAGTNAWPTANKALFMPVIFPAPGTITAVSFRPTTAAGNYDLGLYLPTFAKVQSSGALACSDADKTLTLTTPLSVKYGDLYFIGLALSSASDSVASQNLGAWVNSRVGVYEQATALPLPDPFVPAAITLAIVPLFKFAFAGLS